EEEFHIIIFIALGQIVDARDGARGHGTRRRTEAEDNVLFSAKIAQADAVAVERGAFKIGSALPRPRTSSENVSQAHVLGQRGLGTVIVVVVVSCKLQIISC